MYHESQLCDDFINAESNLEEAYFLGAGASISSGIPLTNQFVPYLLQKSNDLRLNDLKQFIEDFFPHSRNRNFDLPKFEQILSIVDLALLEDHELGKNYNRSKLSQLRSDMDYLIWHMLEQSTRQSSAVFEEFCQLINPQKHLLMSLNYDTLLDHALLKIHGSLDYGVGFSAVYGTQNKTLAENSDVKPVYIKLHGSINWLQCPNCQSFFCYKGAEELARVFDQKAELCPYDSGYLRGILVSPTWNKRYTSAPLSILWIKASKLLRNIRRITFVGYSLSDVDLRVIYLIKRSLFNNPKTVEIRLVDPDPTGKILNRYERLFGSVKLIQSSFSDFTASKNI